MTKKLATLVLFALAAAAPTTQPPEIPAGAITGTITLEPPPPPRRTANRYPGAATATRIEQKIPAVVYLQGAIPGSPPGYVANPEMMQQDTAFAPSGVALQVGGTVSFPNSDPFFHNVLSYSGAKSFDLGRYPEGESKEVVFDQPGIVELFCEVHDFMRGIIVVTENPYHAVATEDGSFSIEGIPAGQYTLVAWHPDYETVEQSVTVTDGGSLRIEVELPL